MINRGIKDPSVTLESSRERSGIIIPVKIDPERLRASILQLGRESPSPGQPAAFSGPSEQSQLGREGKGGGFSQQSPKTGEEPRGKRCRAGKAPGRERTRSSQRGRDFLMESSPWIVELGLLNIKGGWNCWVWMCPR